MSSEKDLLPEGGRNNFVPVFKPFGLSSTSSFNLLGPNGGRILLTAILEGFRRVLIAVSGSMARGDREDCTAVDPISLRRRMPSRWTAQYNDYSTVRGARDISSGAPI